MTGNRGHVLSAAKGILFRRLHEIAKKDMQSSGLQVDLMIVGLGALSLILMIATVNK